MMPIYPEMEEHAILFYFRKWRGVPGHKNPQKIKSFIATIWSWVAAVFGIGLVAALHYFVLQPEQLQFIIGSFGASAVLIYGEPKSPLAQPRNLVGGHIVSAIVGCIFRIICAPHYLYLGAPFAVATAIVAMQLTKTTHPPGGATALIAVTSPPLPWFGFMYVFMPVTTGALAMLLVALIFDNIPRRYPIYWW